MSAAGPSQGAVRPLGGSGQRSIESAGGNI